MTNEEDWPVMSAEEAFSDTLYRPNFTLESLVEKLIGPQPDLANLNLRVVNEPSCLNPDTVVDVPAVKKKRVKWKLKMKRSDATSQANADKTVSFEDAVMDLRKWNVAESKGDEKVEAKMQLALKLGAKKPKNKALSYDALKEQRKQDRLEAKKKRAEKKYDRLKKTKSGRVKKKLKKKIGDATR